MNNEKLKKKVNYIANELIYIKGFIAPVDLLMEMDILSKKDYENWRFGRVKHLEKVCRLNLKKLSLVMKQLRKFANKNKLKPSQTVYKKWGKGRKITLQFSKYNNPKIEKHYKTHYVDLKRVKELK
ncbi:MAG: hypothetical protein FH751_17305 [Firmicutes bacterium]|nr:hypothetical protein [Bacillota bacterium]